MSFSKIIKKIVNDSCMNYSVIRIEKYYFYENISFGNYYGRHAKLVTFTKIYTFLYIILHPFHASS